MQVDPDSEMMWPKDQDCGRSDAVTQATDPSMCEVIFQPSGQRHSVRPGTRLLKCVLNAGLPIGYACRGLGVCVACALWVRGEVSEIEAAEAALLHRVDGPHIRGLFRLRIACFVRIEGGVEVHADYWGPYP